MVMPKNTIQFQFIFFSLHNYSQVNFTTERLYSKNKKRTEETMLYGGSERGPEKQSFKAGHLASKKYAI